MTTPSLDVVKAYLRETYGDDHLRRSGAPVHHVAEHLLVSRRTVLTALRELHEERDRR